MTVSQGLNPLLERAQSIANQTKTPRYLVHTSLGWRIESEHPNDEAVLGTPLYYTLTPGSEVIFEVEKKGAAAWRVRHAGRLCAPGFITERAAHAYLRAIQRGDQTPAW